MTWLEATDPFPSVERALKNPNGLLAAGGDLSVQRLLQAYRHGVFPWYSAPEPILWWSPDPRMVLHCDELYAVGTLGGELFNQFFDKYAFRLELELGSAAHAAASGQCVVRPLEDYCRQQVKC